MYTLLLHMYIYIIFVDLFCLYQPEIVCSFILILILIIMLLYGVIVNNFGYGHHQKKTCNTEIHLQ